MSSLLIFYTHREKFVHKDNNIAIFGPRHRNCQVSDRHAKRLYSGSFAWASKGEGQSDIIPFSPDSIRLINALISVQPVRLPAWYANLCVPFCSYAISVSTKLVSLKPSYFPTIASGGISRFVHNLVVGREGQWSKNEIEHSRSRVPVLGCSMWLWRLVFRSVN